MELFWSNGDCMSSAAGPFATIGGGGSGLVVVVVTSDVTVRATGTGPHPDTTTAPAANARPVIGPKRDLIVVIFASNIHP
jgi:hypothetical protein